MNGGKKIASILFVCAAIYIENKEQLCLSQRTKAMHVTYTNQMQHQSHIKSQDDYERGVKMAEDRIPSTQWRRYGIERRKELVYKDEQKGGTSFVVNPECPIQRYFSLSQRVISQFKSMCDNLESEAEAAYVMAHRLKTFLSEALPKHPEYSGKSTTRMRNKSIKEMVWIEQRMSEIALKIDEEQLNKFMMNDFDPEPSDDSTVSSEEAGVAEGDQNWENFTGWSPFDISSGDESPHLTDTDASSNSREDSYDYSLRASSQTSQVIAELDVTMKKCMDAEMERIKESQHNIGAQFPWRFEDDDATPQVNVEIDSQNGQGYFPSYMDQTRIINEDDDDIEYEPDPEPVFYIEDNNDVDEHQERDFIEETGLESVLDRIASEEVRYESDSEAVDSWAQDCEKSEHSGTISSGTSLTCDPARLAFREVMNKLSQASRKEAGNPPECHSNRWARFAFASVRQDDDKSS